MDVEERIRLATMKQTLMRQALAPAAVCEDSRIDINLDESVLILLKHCQSMKQQETRLRLITLLLLLSCSALFIFTTFRHQENLEPGRQGSTAVQSAAYSKQERECPAATDDHQRLRIHLREASTNDYQQETTNGLYIKWDLVFGEYYDEEKQAIVIPKDGIYFVYLRIHLTCLSNDDETTSQSFNVEIRKWNEGYQKNMALAKIWDGIVCTPEGSRTVFVGQLFDLSADDRVRVWIGNGSRLIARLFFGAYLV